MRFLWRSVSTPLTSSRQWIGQVESKNRQAGTSAPTLALAWSGPVDVLGALATHPDFSELAIGDVVVEAKSRFDSYAGNVRNHDLVLRGTCDGAPLVVCIEAKAGEPLGATVAEQVVAAARALEKNPRSNAPARITDLVDRLCRHPLEDPRVGSLRYQLLTAWAGTLAEAVPGARLVFVLHEFRTEQRPEDKSALNGAELERFAEAVLGCQLPAAGSAPWCVRVPDVEAVDAALYVAHVVTDLRESALQSA